MKTFAYMVAGFGFIIGGVVGYYVGKIKNR